MSFDPRALLLSMFEAAIAAAQPARGLARFLPEPPAGRTLVIGAGKASAAMAAALEAACEAAAWPGSLSGLVVTRTGYRVPCRRIEIVEAAHPVPDAAGFDAARRMMDLVSGLTADDLVIALISGGGSALLPLPLPGIDLAQKQAVNSALLASGATIGEINCVRRHLSAIKGGRLGVACHPARVVNLLISDVPGDRPIDIASGPLVGDPSTVGDALDIIRRYRLDLPPSVLRAMTVLGESVKPDDPRLARIETHLIATPRLALTAAAACAEAAGVTPYLLSDAIEGEARDVGTMMAALARTAADPSAPFAPFRAPCVLLSGGETSVTVRGTGRGGRNVEYLLSLALGLDGADGIYALAGDTDGVDGVEEIAGAVITPDTLARARTLGISPREALARNDGHGFFASLGDAVVTGPTYTNVNDFRAVLVMGGDGHSTVREPKAASLVAGEGLSRSK